MRGQAEGGRVRGGGGRCECGRGMGLSVLRLSTVEQLIADSGDTWGSTSLCNTTV